MKPFLKKEPVNKSRLLAKMMTEEEQAVLDTERQFHANEKAMLRPRSRRQPKDRQAQKPAMVRQAKPKSDAASIPPLQLYHTPETLLANASPVRGDYKGLVMSTGQPVSNSLTSGNHYVDAMLSGYATMEDRMPDPYTCVKTFPVVTHFNQTILPIPPTSGVTTYAGNALVVMGSGVNSTAFATLTPGVGAVAIDWTTLAGLQSCGVNSSSLLARPIGKVDNFTFNLIGVKHTITMCAVPILPKALSTGFTSTAAASFPTALSAGLTTVNSLWGGRQWQVEPGDTISLISAPLDNRSFDFEASSSERSSYDALGQIAWSGWIIWFWGATVGDTVLMRTQLAEECAYAPNSNVLFNYPQSRIEPKPLESAHAKGLFANLMDAGYGAVKYAATTLAPLAVKAWDTYIGRTSTQMGAARSSMLGLQQETNPSGYLSHGFPIVNRQSRAPVPRGKQSEEKDRAIEDLPLNLSSATRAVNALTDEPEVVTPQSARRSSLAPSLSSRRK